MPRSVQCIAVAIFMAATVIVSSACWLLGASFHLPVVSAGWSGLDAGVVGRVSSRQYQLGSRISRIRDTLRAIDFRRPTSPHWRYICRQDNSFFCILVRSCERNLLT